MKLTPNFNREEFQCKCNCGKDTVDVQLMQILNDLRLHFKKPLHIHSGYRCPSYNKEIGGSPKSQHMEGKAADFHIEDTTIEEIYSYLCFHYPDRYGIGIYGDSFIHVDSREDKARWQE